LSYVGEWDEHPHLRPAKRDLGPLLAIKQEDYTKAALKGEVNEFPATNTRDIMHFAILHDLSSKSQKASKMVWGTPLSGIYNRQLNCSRAEPLQDHQGL